MSVLCNASAHIGYSDWVPTSSWISTAADSASEMAIQQLLDASVSVPKPVYRALLRATRSRLIQEGCSSFARDQLCSISLPRQCLARVPPGRTESEGKEWHCVVRFKLSNFQCCSRGAGLDTGRGTGEVMLVSVNHTSVVPPHYQTAVASMTKSVGLFGYHS